MASINNVNFEMTSSEILYDVLVNTENENYVPIESYDFSTVSVDIRSQWAEQILQGLQSGRSGLQAIRTCKIVLNKNGTADVYAAPTLPTGKCRYVYPTRFRIPPATIADLVLQEQVVRAENFAFGSLLYHIYSDHRPFDNLPDECVEARFANAEIPDDILNLDQWPMILSCWSFEFARDLNGNIPSTPLERFRNHFKSHPYLSAIQASGLLLGAASVGAPLILGAAGFGALGPVAGSAAAGWQSSVGLVQVGSFFAWCQSAAMGGAAASGITTAGAVGASAAVGATLAGFVTKESVGDISEEKVRDMYRRSFRTGPKTGREEKNREKDLFEAEVKK